MDGNRGFTLIEILLTLTVLSVLLMIGIPQFTDFSTDARKVVTKERLSAIREALLGDPRLISGGVYVKPGYFGNCQKFPDSLGSLETQPGDAVAEPVCASPYDAITRFGWNGPYLDTNGGLWDEDAWGTPFQYAVVNASPTFQFTVTSCGPNTTCGDSDDISVSY